MNNEQYNELMDFLMSNGYDGTYLNVNDTIKIINLDLDDYDNIDYIDCDMKTMYIAIKEEFADKRNHGFNDNFNLSDYGSFSEDEFYLYIDVTENDLLKELKKFKKKGEYIKGIKLSL